MASNKSEYQVTGMTCGHCEAAVREEVEQIPGVEGIRVSAQTGTLIVNSSSEVDDDHVVAAVEEAGYTAQRVR
ncbi:heavy-metal-associated domain-containing protein [Tersicoccus sp. Bi-70]|uniref:heavy-metal-associated domain-containing protein n=1 Tax=Tersicoccus sp. Bi-70 TaxID=1897634 RepID=UPI0009782C2D|nr:heavy-metal-associated domain-containing protein [Tersicoccus sp. Bi-70]OMH36309.1 heavy metal transporter [Tersicoccus sp. Bi-70]